MKTRIQHDFDLPAEKFFDRVFYNEELNGSLFDALKFRERTVVLCEDRGDVVYREVRQVPERDIPAAIKKVLGADSFGYVEKSTYRKGSLRADIEVIPTIKPDKVTIRGAMWVEPLGPARCRRVFELDVDVKVFGVGGMIEKMVITDTEKSYETAARLTADYLRANP